MRAIHSCFLEYESISPAMTWIETAVTARTDWAEDLATFTCDAQPDFVPGQFINLALDLDGKRVVRSYSIAAAPGQPLAFFVSLVPGGTLTPSLFGMKPGAKLWVAPRAAGLLTVEFVPDFARELWLVATGTGLAPFLSMLRAGVLLPRFERVVIVHGVRHARHLAYREELSALARVHEPLHYLPVVSRDGSAGIGLQGRITTALASGELEAKAGLALDEARSHVMLCGNPGMIRDATELLLGRGLRRHRRREPGHITQEKYW